MTRTFLAVLALAGCGPAQANPQGDAVDFHVSPAGDDAGPGTSDRPFATLARARDAVRERKLAVKDRDLRVRIRGGRYLLRETVVFDLRDSAPEGRHVIYEAQPGESPVFTSGVPLEGWRKAEEDLPGLPPAARGHVRVANLPEGLPGFNTLYDGDGMLPRAAGPAFFPESPSGEKIDLFTLRFPAGALKAWAGLEDVEIHVIPGNPWITNILPLASVDEAARTARTSVPATYPMTRTWGDAEFKELHGGTVRAENLFEGMTGPGRWVLRRKPRKVYLWPRDGEPGTVHAPALTELVRVEGRIDYDGPADEPVRGIVFEGLTFTQGDRWPWEADKTNNTLQHDWEMFDRPTALVRFRGAERCAVRRCRFVESGGTAVRLDLHAQECAIEGNEISRIGGAGILLAGYGPGTKDVNRRNAVTDNRIDRVGTLLWHSAGIFAWQSGENRIAHNLIHHTPYCAIVVSGRILLNRAGKAECSRTVRWHEVDPVLEKLQGQRDWYAREPFLHGRRNVVELNDLHHVMEKIGDGNAIYVSGTGRDIVVRRNFIHDIPSRTINAAIRCDDDQYLTVIHQNLIVDCGGEGFIFKGKNTVTNNIVAGLRTKDPEGIPCRHQRGHLVLPYANVEGGEKGSVVRRNIFYATDPEVRLLHESKGGRKPACLLRNCEADENVYFNARDPEWGARHLEEQRRHGIEGRSVAADPGFVDPGARDFRLKPGSPALVLGFEPFDVSEAGPRPGR